MPSVVVTGPRGLLGSTVVRVFRDAGFDVYPYEGDITSLGDLQTFVATLPSLDVVVHTAAATDVNRCEREPEWCTSVNVDGTRNVRDVAASRGARLLHISTVSVFDGLTGNYREDDVPNPKNVYNVSKYLAEQAVSEYENALTLRINIIGIHPDGSRGKNFFEWLVDSVRANNDIKLFTDVRMNPLSHWTLAELMRDIVRQWPADRVLHLGSSTVLSKADVGKLVLAAHPAYTGTVACISVDSLSDTAYRPKEMWLNVDRASVVLARKLPTLQEEVRRCLMA